MNMRLLYIHTIKIPLLFAWLVLSGPAFSQSVANNANPESITAVSLFRFSDELNENSGMVYYNDLFWTFNDSGGEATLFGVDEKGTIRVRVHVGNATNVDWEDIAQDSKYLYIADTGNNGGNRRNLGIYRFPKTMLPANGDKVVKADFMGYSYEDQTDFNQTAHAHPFDCEALIVSNDSLYLFTKDWKNERTALYVLHFGEKESVARKRGEFAAGGLVTGADISPNGKIMALSGYAQMKPFVWVFKDFKSGKPFSGDSLRIDLGMLFMSQTEGVTVTNEGRILISCEQTPLFPAQIFELVKEPGLDGK